MTSATVELVVIDPSPEEPEEGESLLIPPPKLLPAAAGNPRPGGRRALTVGGAALEYFGI